MRTYAHHPKFTKSQCNQVKIATRDFSKTISTNIHVAVSALKSITFLGIHVMYMYMHMYTYISIHVIHMYTSHVFFTLCKQFKWWFMFDSVHITPFMCTRCTTMHIGAWGNRHECGLNSSYMNVFHIFLFFIQCTWVTDVYTKQWMGGREERERERERER